MLDHSNRPFAGADGAFSSYTSGAQSQGTCVRQSLVSVFCAAHIYSGTYTGLSGFSPTVAGSSSGALQNSLGPNPAITVSCTYAAFLASPTACTARNACAYGAALGGTFGLCFPNGAVTQVPAGGTCTGPLGRQSCSAMLYFGNLVQTGPLTYNVANGNNNRRVGGTSSFRCLRTWRAFWCLLFPTVLRFLQQPEESLAITACCCCRSVSTPTQER